MQTAQIALRRQSAMLDFEEGRLPEAEAALTNIISELRTSANAGNSYELCRSLIDRATVLNFSNRWEDALLDLKECATAAQHLKAMNARMVLVNVYQQQAKLYATQFSTVYDPTAARVALNKLGATGFTNWFIGQTVADLAYQERDWKTAATGYREVAQELSSQGWLRGAAASRLKAGRAFLEQNDLIAAKFDLEAALAFFDEFGPPDILATTKIHMARLWLARGEADHAWELAQDALRLIEAAIRKFQALFDQQRFVVDKLAHYQYAFAIGLAKDGTEGCWRAWSVAERAKSFYLCQLVANAGIGFFEGVDQEQISQLRELETQLDECEATLGRLAMPGSDTQLREQMEQRLTELSAAKMELQEGMRRANPRWAALATPPPFELTLELKKIDPAWAPLSYFWQPAPEGALLHLFHAGKDREPRHASTTWSHDELEQLDQTRERLRGVLSPIAKIFPAELVEKILPLEISGQLERGQRLLISPHDRLRGLPLHVLPVRSEKRLIDLCPVQYIPTMTLLPFRKVESRQEKVLLMGCAQDGFSSPPLNEVKGELESLDGVWSITRSGKVTKRLIATQGTPAEAGVPMENWGDFDVLHFACHGDFPEGRPFDAALRLGKDAVRTTEFFGVKLEATLISLSACSLGRQTQRHSGIHLEGDEWIGLYLPLFYAGTQGLVVSLWDANSQVAASFMETLHRTLSEGSTLAEAFQRGIQSVDRKPEPLWANWYLVGFPN